jgi:predicted SnoaL-like aldol condensation-catalyzing enzyme
MVEVPGHSVQENANMHTVTDFYEAGLNRKNADEAIRYLGTSYVQHNPNAADGVDGFRHFVAGLQLQSPRSQSEIKRVFADGDFVILHVHKIVEPATPGVAIIDIFRLDAGRIVEHWDVTQAIPDRTASGNPMI